MALPDAIDFQKNRSASPARMNVAMTALDARLRGVEAQRAKLDEALLQIQTAGLQRIDDVLGPAARKIFAILSSGFLLAHSSTPNTLTIGPVLTFVVPPGDERDLFVPSPFVTVSRTSTMDDYAFARTVGYDAASGAYDCAVLAAHGDPGPHDDWVIQDGTGASAAMMDALAAVQAATAQVAADRADVDAVNARFTVSSQPPSGGHDGDIWLKY